MLASASSTVSPCEWQPESGAADDVSPVPGIFLDHDFQVHGLAPVTLAAPAARAGGGNRAVQRTSGYLSRGEIRDFSLKRSSRPAGTRS